MASITMAAETAKPAQPQTESKASVEADKKQEKAVELKVKSSKKHAKKVHHKEAVSDSKK